MYLGLLYARPDGADLWGNALAPITLQERGFGGTLDSTDTRVAYDGFGRLISEHWIQYRDGGFPLSGNDTITYDRRGNIGAGPYDPVTDALLSSGVYTYDRAGNLATRTLGGVTRIFQYDALQRLTSIREGATLIARYAYDVLGRRIAKRVYSGSTGGTVGYTRFVYDGQQVAYETDSAGTMGKQYIWGLGTDNLIGYRSGGTDYLVATDGLGSVRSIGMRNGTWIATRRYDWNGAVRTPDFGAWPSDLRYGWQGREFDAETGLYYFRARYYSPGMRRFTQEDPLGYAGGANLYTFVDGRWLEARDPSGRLTEDCWASGCPSSNGYIFMDMINGGDSYNGFGYSSTYATVQQPEPKVEVGCRYIDFEAFKFPLGHHCAIRVTFADGEVRFGELLKDKPTGKNIVISFDGTSQETLKYRWTTIATPKGMSPGQFASEVNRAFDTLAQGYNGLTYSKSGIRNSNKFVYDVITSVGGRIPFSVMGSGATPGICGGQSQGWLSSYGSGLDCSPVGFTF